MSNYTGNEVAVEPPATAPEYNNPVVLYLPVDTDGATWANVYQALKVLADNATLVLKAIGGTLKSAGGLTAPTPTFNRGWLYKESVPFSFASVSSAGAFVSGMNIASCSRTGTGVYTVNLSVAASATNRMIILGSCSPTIGMWGGAASTTSQIFVNTRNTAGALTDLDFHMAVFHV